MARRVILTLLGVAVAVPVLALAVSSSARNELGSLASCYRSYSDKRPIASKPTERFRGKVIALTGRCRGLDPSRPDSASPWVDWAGYWGAADSSSESRFWFEPVSRFSRNQRGIDGALIDLEYQRIELLKFNLFDNHTYADYLSGKGGTGGRALKEWQAMRLPPDHPQYQAVGGDGQQLCKGELIRHRTVTGICNDIYNPLMGSTNTLFARNVQFEETFPDLGATELIRNRHGDRIGLLRPDPQVVSRELFTRQQSNPASCKNGSGGQNPECDYIKAPFFNVLAAIWIQFMTHDWFSHLEEGQNGAEMMEVGCATRRDGQGERPLTPDEITRTGCRPGDRVDRAIIAQSDAPSQTDGANGAKLLTRAHRTTRNTNTAWWDASQLYGYSERSLLRVKRDPADPARLLMPPVGGRTWEGERQGYLPLFAAGDPIHAAWTGQEAVAFPDNWNIGLSLYHNIFSREHNLVVDEFRRRQKETPDEDSGLRNPAAPDKVIRYRDATPEEIYQVARLVVAAEIAKIHTIEWTTQLLYDEVLYLGMNANWHGLFRTDNRMARALEKLTIDVFGNSRDEADQTLWYSIAASGAGIFGLGSRRYEGELPYRSVKAGAKDIWSISEPTHVNGGVNHFGSPFNFPEEFVTVYRLHPLVPDVLEFRDIAEPNAIQRKVPAVTTFRGGATAAMRDGGLADWALTMGRQRLGALTLQNHPMFLQNLPMPRLRSTTGKLDVPALDLIRDRERGVPRFNEFRRQYGLTSLRSFDDFIDQRLPSDSPERKRQETLVLKLREVYGQHVCDDSKTITAVQELNGKLITDCLGHPDGTLVDNVEDLDTVVGWLAEFRRPHGFAISETQFTVFILNASRRLFSDRFFTSSFRPEFYSTLGIEWVNNNGPSGKVLEEGVANGHTDEVSPFKRVLLRTMPELASELKGVVNAFDPWARDRGSYYSLQWKPRPGAESDPAFRQ